jgi:hypothetical protein
MKKHLYIETTVVSYLTAKPSRDIMIIGHQEATRELWAKLSSRYKAYVSALVFVEAGGYICPEICSPEELLEVEE